MQIELTKLFREFLKGEQFTGVMLILCTAASMVIANSSLGRGYTELWNIRIGFQCGDITLRYSLAHWINEGLMTIFFLLIGLEIERELYIGELSEWKNASLPIFAAMGGMVIPALIHFLFNQGTGTQPGIGIPIATDIAFALGALALLGNKIPLSLRVFLTALAIIDDLGAIIVIAVFYATDLSVLYLISALGVFLSLLVFNRLGVRRLLFYLAPGVLMWFCMLKSGVHPTIAGVLLAFAIPFGQGDEESPSYKLQLFLHRPVALIVMPLFALANTGIVLTEIWSRDLLTANSIGIFVGLCLGKPFGITMFSLFATKLGLSHLPSDVSWKHIIGAGSLGGIGFTMSIFITLLAFGDHDIVQTSKAVILLSSFLSGAIGFLILSRTSNAVNWPI